MKEAKKAANEVFMHGFYRIYETLEPHMSSPRRYIALIHNYASIFTQRVKYISVHTGRLAVSTL